MNISFLSISADKSGEQIVRRPRHTDAIGHALRGAFDHRAGLPDEMAALLCRLDRIPGATG